MTLALIALTLAMAQAAPALQPSGYRGNLSMSMWIELPEAPTTSDGDAITVTAARTHRARLATSNDRAARMRRCTLRQGFGIAPVDERQCGNLLECMKANATRERVKTCMTTRLESDLRRHFGADRPTG